MHVLINLSHIVYGDYCCHTGLKQQTGLLRYNTVFADSELRKNEKEYTLSIKH